MAYEIQECKTEECRILVLVAETKVELEALRSKAMLKGWEEYFDGLEPATGRPAAWMKKSLQKPS